MHRLTARGWLLLTVLTIVAGLALGLLLSPGTDPCSWHGAGLPPCRR